jgi:hypothetical protein
MAAAIVLDSVLTNADYRQGIIGRGTRSWIGAKSRAAKTVVVSAAYIRRSAEPIDHSRGRREVDVAHVIVVGGAITN